MLLLFLCVRRLHHQMKNARTLIATTPPMTPPATATVDCTALLSELGIALASVSAEVEPVESATTASVGVGSDSMVVRSGVATGPSGRSGGEDSAGVGSDEAAGVSATAGAVTLASA